MGALFFLHLDPASPYFDSLPTPDLYGAPRGGLGEGFGKRVVDSLGGNGVRVGCGRGGILVGIRDSKR